MVFPYTVLDQRIDILLSGVWTDITDYVQRRDGLVRIRRGRSDQASSMERSTANMSINNRDGRFSVGNPTGPYYGVLNRNTPLRISLPAATSYLRMPGTADADEIACPDAAALGITGDIDIRIDLGLDTWRSAQRLAGKWRVTSNQGSWRFDVSESGLLQLTWSTDGTLVAVVTATSTLPVPVAADHRNAVRVTLDVNNGAGGNTATFYTSDTINGTWTQLGDPVVTSGTTSIFDSTAPLEVGSVSDLTTGPLVTSPAVTQTTGEIYAFQLRSGIAGTVVANPDFTIQTAGDDSFADTAGTPNTWTIAGAATIDNRDYRFHGEVPAWPSRWDSTGTDIWVPIEASGVTRRLNRTSPTLYSALRRAVTKSDNLPVAYWPCEDDTGSTSIASGLPGGMSMEVVGSPNYATSSAFDCSDSLPTVNLSAWNGAVPTYTATGEMEFKFLLKLPTTPLTDGVALTRVFTTGTSYTWDIGYRTANGGSILVLVWDSSGVLVSTGTAVTNLNGLALRVTMWASQNGANIDYSLETRRVDTGAISNTTNSITGKTVGAAVRVYVSPGSDVGDAAFGHISIRDTVTDEPLTQLQAYLGETAGRRIERLCLEEDVEFRNQGDLDASMAMGPQLVASLTSLIGDAVTADGGMLYEPRQGLELGYRTRSSLYNQPVTLTLDYSAGELAGELQPLGDDQDLENDVVATRVRGSSARVVATEGMLTPALIGTYPGQISVNVQTDDILEDIAGWRVHLGTVEEDRFPSISVNLANTRIAADTALVAEASIVDMGDRINVTNPLAGQTPDTIDQLVQGSTETLGNYERFITWNTSPASSYDVLQLNDDTYGKWDTGGSVLGVAATSTATTLIVYTTQDDDTKVRPNWTEDSGEYPFGLKTGGEAVTATAGAPLAADTFTRTVASGGWGTASDGHTYTLTGGNASDRSVAGTYGLVTLASAPTTIRHQTVGESCRDVEVRASVAVSAVATGASLAAGITARYTSSTAFYRLRVDFTTSGTVSLAVTRNTTVIGAVVATGIDYAAGSIIEVRVRFTGNRVMARAWESGKREASRWHIDRTVTSSTIADGEVGLAASGLTGNTNVNPEIRFHDWLIESPQKITVTRSVNSVVKAQAIGTSVSLSKPLVYPL
jgi:hypothetical protein